MIEITSWLDVFQQKLDMTFGERVWFVGLQGSYARGEATDHSDIDVVVILDELSTNDIGVYNAMLDSLSHRELICGFISGKQELLNWEPSDLFQFYFDTKPIKGSLEDIRSSLTVDSVKRAIKSGACNIYHSCVHNMLHEKREEVLRGLYKSAFFVTQAIHYLKTGKYICWPKDLQAESAPAEQVIINTYMGLKFGTDTEFHIMSEALFQWAGNLIKTY